MIRCRGRHAPNNLARRSRRSTHRRPTIAGPPLQNDRGSSSALRGRWQCECRWARNGLPAHASRSRRWTPPGLFRLERPGSARARSRTRRARGPEVGTVSGTPSLPDASRLRTPDKDGLPFAYEYVVAVTDSDSSGSHTEGDAIAGWVCVGKDSVRLIYLDPPTDPNQAFALRLSGIPSGWLVIRGFDGPNSLEVPVADRASLMVSDTACTF